ETDSAYLKAMKAAGLKKVMLSYMEEEADLAAVREILPDAEMVLKIETEKGLDFARQHRASQGRLMAARGDLYVEVLQPHHIIGALRTIIQADPEAVVASRIFDSLGFHPVPTSADISDAAFLLSLGYRTFMLGDIVSLRRDPLIEALNLLEAVAEEFAAV
ncbi:MAG: pyruvate kinase, partial [Anaerolineales bacterium]